MTNREWLIKEMQNMSDEEVANKFLNIHCNMCAFENNCYGKRCADGVEKWLKAEHKEKPKLSEAERVILENIDKNYKWIARDSDGMLGIYDNKPQKDGEEMWHSAIMRLNSSTLFDAFDHLFQFIQWSDAEPYNIEELLGG